MSRRKGKLKRQRRAAQETTTFDDISPYLEHPTTLDHGVSNAKIKLRSFPKCFPLNKWTIAVSPSPLCVANALFCLPKPSKNSEAPTFRWRRWPENFSLNNNISSKNKIKARSPWHLGTCSLPTSVRFQKQKFRHAFPWGKRTIKKRKEKHHGSNSLKKKNIWELWSNPTMLYFTFENK